MSNVASISWSERRERAFEELCDLGMGLARKLAAQGEEAETQAETERCAQAFDRVARSVRLTFALQARLEREHRRGRAEDVMARKDQVRDAVRAVIRPNVPTGERYERERELDDRLAVETLAPDFLDRPIDGLIARIRQDLRLEAADLETPQENADPTEWGEAPEDEAPEDEAEEDEAAFLLVGGRRPRPPLVEYVWDPPPDLLPGPVPDPASGERNHRAGCTSTTL